MFNDIIEQLNRYINDGETVALAQVVWRQAPTSGKPGDKAIVRKDGTLIGWVGGGCIRGIVVKECQNAIEEQECRLVKIAPDYSENTDPDSSVKTYKMTCHGGGSMEIFIEPVMPAPHIIVLGKSNIARALVRISRAANYKVSVIGNDADKEVFPDANELIPKLDFGSVKINPNTFIIVCTQGDNDEEAVKEALLSRSHYVGFVASKKKSNHMKSYLESSGIDSSEFEKLKSPAGIDINAKLPEEVAISILADIINDFRNRDVLQFTGATHGDKATLVTSLSDEYYLNPVCNLPISKAEAKHIVDYKGHKVYFCCDGCKVSFDKTPEHYIEIIENPAKNQG